MSLPARDAGCLALLCFLSAAESDPTVDAGGCRAQPRHYPLPRPSRHDGARLLLLLSRNAAA